MMKNFKKPIWIFALTITFILLVYPRANSSSQELKQLMSQIEKAEAQKLPKTALELSLKLETQALAENNKGVLIRAIVKKVLNRSHVLGGSPKEKIKLLRSEISKLPADSKPLVKILLARWFWHYYEQNIYKFSSRTSTVGLDSDDFTTWDLPKLFSEIRSLFEEGLKDGQILKNLKIGDFESVVERECEFEPCY